ncbi:hypothetical protein ACS04_28520 [Streptomyces roseus]|uniref:Uncharacterized protein n=1 Tax=Streptomyces roseus TaxID=66430 RepID=A0A0J6XJZ8_9ACTN|nr:hypothetical protein ACS04_28520 [Streptomyces roseus]
MTMPFSRVSKDPFSSCFGVSFWPTTWYVRILVRVALSARTLSRSAFGIFAKASLVGADRVLGHAVERTGTFRRYAGAGRAEGLVSGRRVAGGGGLAGLGLVAGGRGGGGLGVAAGVRAGGQGEGQQGGCGESRGR